MRKEISTHGRTLVLVSLCVGKGPKESGKRKVIVSLAEPFLGAACGKHGRKR